MALFPFEPVNSTDKKAGTLSGLLKDPFGLIVRPPVAEALVGAITSAVTGVENFFAQIVDDRCNDFMGTLSGRGP